MPTRFYAFLVVVLAIFFLIPDAAIAQAVRHSGGEANLVLPDLNQGSFLGFNGRTLLMSPAMVAAAAISGCVSDVRELMKT